MQVDALKAALKQRGLPTTGLKPVLAARLSHALNPKPGSLADDVSVPCGEDGVPSPAELPTLGKWLTDNLSSPDAVLRTLAQNLYCERYIGDGGAAVPNGAETYSIGRGRIDKDKDPWTCRACNKVRPEGCCSPRHTLPFHSTNEDSKAVGRRGDQCL